MLTCRLVDDFDELSAIAPSWYHLLSKSEFDDVFLTHAYMKAWWTSFGANKLLRVVLLEESGTGKLRAIAPFFADPLSPCEWKLIGDVRADYCNVICEKGDAEALNQLFVWLLQLSEWQIITMRKVPGHAGVLGHFSKTCGPESTSIQKLDAWMTLSSPIVYRNLHHQHPVISQCRLEEQQSLLDSKNYVRQLKWFARQGTLEYRCVRTPDECLALLPEFLSLYVRNWRSNSINEQELRNQNERYFMSLIHELSAQNAVRLDLLTLDRRIIAAHLGFNWCNRVYYYKPCFDLNLSSHRPGKLLLAYIIREAARNGAAELDLLKGNEAYKNLYASHNRTTGSLRVYRSRVNALKNRVGFT